MNEESLRATQCRREQGMHQAYPAWRYEAHGLVLFTRTANTHSKYSTIVTQVLKYRTADISMTFPYVGYCTQEQVYCIVKGFNQRLVIYRRNIFRAVHAQMIQLIELSHVLVPFHGIEETDIAFHWRHTVYLCIHKHLGS
jgi:hypothetical protein